jgi:hypothetical protein
MPAFLQLSATSWLNLDAVAHIEQVTGLWYVWFIGATHSETLSPEEGEVVAHYLYAHAERTAYAQTQRRREE